MTISKIFILVLGILALSVRIKNIIAAKKENRHDAIRVEIIFIGVIFLILIMLFFVMPKL